MTATTEMEVFVTPTEDATHLGAAQIVAQLHIERFAIRHNRKSDGNYVLIHTMRQRRLFNALLNPAVVERMIATGELVLYSGYDNYYRLATQVTPRQEAA